ncbi:MAG: FAD-dependent oxidoreductase, partial [Rhodobacteraceae bacterium]|nr:FAD-dependent oxidoreductase [Paracoccaceae bacterium]
MTRYSAFAILREALRGHSGWGPAWRRPAPKPRYDVVIVGAGGHGLATACYLGRNHGITNVAVLEKGWLGGGNTGRNTTIIRSNYLQDPSAAIYEKSRAL